MSNRISAAPSCESIETSDLVGELPRSDDPGQRAVPLAPGACLAEIETTVSEAADEIYRPDHYEANYAYPLLVWLTGENEPHGRLAGMMRQVSERNCFGIAVRPVAETSIADRIFAAVTELRRRYNIHTERIYLAGHADQATLALEIGLAKPEWFGGIVALAPDLERKQRLLARFDALRGKRVFLGTGETSELVESALRMRRLLWTAGLSVHAVSSRFPDEADAGVLRELNRWMIEGIEAEAA